MDDESELLIRVIEGLTPQDRHSVLAFAQYLAERAGAAPLAPPPAPEPARVPAEPFPEPKPLPRPEGERVIAAIKRLSDTYHMFGKNDMMGETSTLLTQHVIEGREAGEVIDELEALFLAHYRELKRGHENGDG